LLGFMKLDSDSTNRSC